MGVRELFEIEGQGGSGHRAVRAASGLQIAQGLGEMGARVAISARKAGELEEAKSQLARHGIDALTVVNDLAKPEQVPALVEAVVDHYGGIDILVNNAGTSWGAPAEELSARGLEQGHELERHQRVRAEPGGRQPLLHPAALRQHHRGRIRRCAARRRAYESGRLLRVEGGGPAFDAGAWPRNGGRTAFASMPYAPDSSRRKWRAACSRPSGRR